jgi:hypothetical protein
VDNQHRQIKGYRELSEKDIAQMNEIKEFGGQLSSLIRNLELHGADERWVEIGMTHLQEGLMALTRAVAKPEFF